MWQKLLRVSVGSSSYSHTVGCPTCNGVRLGGSLGLGEKTHCVHPSVMCQHTPSSFSVCVLFYSPYTRALHRGALTAHGAAAIALRLSWLWWLSPGLFIIEAILFFFLNKRICYLMRGSVSSGSQSRQQVFNGQSADSSTEICFMVQLQRVPRRLSTTRFTLWYTLYMLQS